MRDAGLEADPPSTQPPWPLVREAFDAALELPPSERHAFLAATYAPAVVTQVRSLIRHHEEATRFLEPAGVALLEADGGASVTPEDLCGRVVAGRYTLAGTIGRGGSAVVYEAQDRISGEEVAVKVRPAGDADFDVIRSEAAALRLLRLPGVVDLRDEGTEDDLSFLVMERIVGLPWPGRTRTTGLSWSRIERTTIGLLETLARVHWTGIAHCDLKPGNVLVREDGTAVLLDLGIAQDPGCDEAVRRTLALAGTPRYTSPEQLLGQPGTARSDLYALGVMLYETLSGCDPHNARDAAEVLSFRPHVPPPSLREVTTDVPAHVVELVDALVSTSPEARPASAAAALAQLQAGTYREDDDLPAFLGSRTVIERAVKAARCGNSLDIWGPRDAGRTSTLNEVARILEEGGYEVLRTQSADAPFASLSRVVAPPLSIDTRTAADARAQFTAALASTLRSGTVLISDDADDLDVESGRVLEACRGDGAILRAFMHKQADGVRLPTLHPTDLLPLFAGHERIHHIPSDAAAELHRRTRGLPGAIRRELASWERSGVARWEHGRVVIRRRALERLRGGIRLRSESGEAGAQDECATLLACAELLGAYATIDRCAQVMMAPRWQISAQVEHLVAVGALTVEEEGVLHCAEQTLGSARWPAEHREAVHGRIADALPQHAPERLYHRRLSGDASLAAEDSLAIGRTLLARGRANQACALLADEVGAMRRRGEGASEDAHLRLLLRASLQVGTRSALDHLIYLLGRSRRQSPQIGRLSRIAQAAHLALQRDTDRALELLPPATVELDSETLHSTLSTQMFLARQCEPERAGRLIDEAEAFVQSSGHHHLIGPVLTARAWRAYARDDFVRAAELHERVAGVAETSLIELSSLLNSASARLETGDFGRAKQLAGRARAQAHARRHVHYEARSERILRAVAYRGGGSVEPDTELTDAVATVGVPHLEALIFLNEAAAAWRGGRHVLASRLARHAAEVWVKAGNHWPALLAHALEVGAGVEIPDEELAEHADRLVECPSATLGVQAASLLARPASRHQERLREVARAHADRVPAERWDRRLEIVSIREAVR